jgi:hypothetical protein
MYTRSDPIFMEMPRSCPECGAAWLAEQTCQDAYHQMLFWENENPAYGEVHHLAVLCYHIQHPSLYSPEGLNEAIHLLADFLERGLTPKQARDRNRAWVDSGKHDWNIKGHPASHGSYPQPMRWKMTAVDVTEQGVENYCDSVRGWAQVVIQALRSMQ